MVSGAEPSAGFFIASPFLFSYFDTFAILTSTFKGGFMTDHVYKIIELTGSSSKSVEAAVENAVSRAAQTVRNMRWLQVTETRAHLEDNKIAHWQVTVKIGFTME